MSGWQVSPDRRRSLGGLAILAVAGVVVVFIAVWYVGATSGLIVGAGPNGEGCRTFWGEAPRDVGWSPNGEFLAVTTHAAGGDDSGDPGVRVFRWPGMALVSQARAFGEPFRIDDLGVLRWRSETSTLPPETVSWRMEPGHEPVVDAPGAVPDRTSSETQFAIATSSLGVPAWVQVLDVDGTARLCVAGD
jgi:hypothetical protein